MTSTNIAIANGFKTNYDKLIVATGKVLKAAQNSEASPQDAIEVLDQVVDELSELRQAIPGGNEQPEEEEEQEEVPQDEEKPVPPGQKKEPVGKTAALETDTVEEHGDLVSKQNAEQLALKNKTYSMTAKEQDLDNQLKAAKSRIAELEKFQQETEIESLAEEYAELFAPGLRKAKFDEVVNSTESPKYWETKIEAISEFRGNSVRPAKYTNEWLPQKNAKQNVRQGLKHL